MYNYFNLLDEIQETLEAIQYISACALIINQRAEILNINPPASAALSIKHSTNNSGKKLQLTTDEQFHRITKELQDGGNLPNIRYHMRISGHDPVEVLLKPSLLHGLKDLYLFQFCKISKECDPLKE